MGELPEASYRPGKRLGRIGAGDSRAAVEDEGRHRGDAHRAHFLLQRRHVRRPLGQPTPHCAAMSARTCGSPMSFAPRSRPGRARSQRRSGLQRAQSADAAAAGVRSMRSKANSMPSLLPSAITRRRARASARASRTWPCGTRRAACLLGHAGVELEGSQPISGVSSLFSRPRAFRAAACRCSTRADDVRCDLQLHLFRLRGNRPEIDHAAVRLEPLLGLPGAHVELVRDDARARLELVQSRGRSFTLRSGRR